MTGRAEYPHFGGLSDDRQVRLTRFKQLYRSLLDRSRPVGLTEELNLDPNYYWEYYFVRFSEFGTRSNNLPLEYLKAKYNFHYNNV